MRKKSILLFVILSLVASTILYSQGNFGASYTEVITGKPIYNKANGEKISDEKLMEIKRTKASFGLEPVIDKHGRVESFLFDPEGTGNSYTRDITKRTKSGEAFPPFVMKSVTGKEINSEKLRGKIILLHFQLYFKDPFFNETIFNQFVSMVNDLKISANLVTVVITESAEDEIKTRIDGEKLNLEIIPEARNFSIRYLTICYPSSILIDREGKLVAYYENSDYSRLQQDIKSLISK